MVVLHYMTQKHYYNMHAEDSVCYQRGVTPHTNGKKA